MATPKKNQDFDFSANEFPDFQSADQFNMPPLPPGFPQGNMSQQQQQPAMPMMQRQMPAPPPAPPAPPAMPKENILTLIREDIEEISEAIINEKWADFKTKLADVDTLKYQMTKVMQDMSMRMGALEQGLIGLHRAIFTKVDEYSKGVSDVSAELSAMQRVFKDILPTFTENVKELGAIVESEKASKLTRRKK